MIISASRRTDIPSYYSDWFFNRIKEGYVYVRNPMNPHQVSKVSLSPDVVDGIVFWTKNPAPMLERLEEIRDYTYYFQFTLNPYGKDIEKNVPSKNEYVIPIFKRLSSMIGRERVVWRYDPILFSEKYTLQYHVKYFRMLCDKLAEHTEKCTVSFIDIYKSIKHNIDRIGIAAPSQKQISELMEAFAEIAGEHGIYIDTCAENADFSNFGIKHASCIDINRLERIGKYKLNIKKDKNQRAECGCAESIDIGTYNTCKNGCIYCYANFNSALVNDCFTKHDKQSPLLYGEVSSDDIIKERKMKTCKDAQIDLLDL